MMLPLALIISLRRDAAASMVYASVVTAAIRRHQQHDEMMAR